MMSNAQQAEETRKLLVELLNLLRGQKETNWSRGIQASIDKFDGPNAGVAAGFEGARSIYNSMVAGGCGFSEYFIWGEDEEERIRMNLRLDELRSLLWKKFNS